MISLTRKCRHRRNMKATRSEEMSHCLVFLILLAMIRTSRSTNQSILEDISAALLNTTGCLVSSARCPLLRVPCQNNSKDSNDPQKRRLPPPDLRRNKTLVMTSFSRVSLTVGTLPLHHLLRSPILQKLTRWLRPLTGLASLLFAWLLSSILLCPKHNRAHHQLLFVSMLRSRLVLRPDHLSCLGMT